MSTVVVRRVVATPARPAAEAWDVIKTLIAGSIETDLAHLDEVGGIVISLIAAEAMRDSPLVVHGVGSRLRVYCLYDEDAIAADGASEGALTWQPTAGDWHMSLPAPEEDLEWVHKALSARSARVTARDMADGDVQDDVMSERKKASTLGPIDLDSFLRS